MYVQQGSNISAKMFEGVSDSASDASTHSSLPSLVYSGYGDSGDSGLDTDNVPGDQPMNPEASFDGEAPYNPEEPIEDPKVYLRHLFAFILNLLCRTTPIPSSDFRSDFYKVSSKDETTETQSLCNLIKKMGLHSDNYNFSPLTDSGSSRSGRLQDIPPNVLVLI